MHFLLEWPIQEIKACHCCFNLLALFESSRASAIDDIDERDRLRVHALKYIASGSKYASQCGDVSFAVQSVVHAWNIAATVDNIKHVATPLHTILSHLASSKKVSLHFHSNANL